MSLAKELNRLADAIEMHGPKSDRTFKIARKHLAHEPKGGKYSGGILVRMFNLLEHDLDNRLMFEELISIAGATSPKSERPQDYDAAARIRKIAKHLSDNDIQLMTGLALWNRGWTWQRVTTELGGHLVVATVKKAIKRYAKDNSKYIRVDKPGRKPDEKNGPEISPI